MSVFLKFLIPIILEQYWFIKLARRRQPSQNQNAHPRSLYSTPTSNPNPPPLSTLKQFLPSSFSIQTLSSTSNPFGRCSAARRCRRRWEIRGKASRQSYSPDLRLHLVQCPRAWGYLLVKLNFFTFLSLGLCSFFPSFLSFWTSILDTSGAAGGDGGHAREPDAGVNFIYRIISIWLGFRDLWW